MGLFDLVRQRNSEIGMSIDLSDLELFTESKDLYLKRLAVETCVNMIANTIAQSKFIVRDGKTVKKDDLYYKLNVQPNRNQTATQFWETFIYRLITENEALIVKTDTDDLIIADAYSRNQYVMYEDIFTDVQIQDFTYKRSFPMSEVFYVQYNNTDIMRLIDGLYEEYGKLFSRVMMQQQQKRQIRATVDIEGTHDQSKETKTKIENFIAKAYRKIKEEAVAIIPQQKGITYNEQNTSSGANVSVDEVGKVENGFVDRVATSLHIPIALLHGEMADVEKQTKNYMKFCIKPIINKLQDEANATFFTKEEHLRGEHVEVKPINYVDIFDVAASIDKLISVGFTNNEIRERLGEEKVDDPRLDEHYFTKNYSQAVEDNLEGGDNE